MTAIPPMLALIESDWLMSSCWNLALLSSGLIPTARSKEEALLEARLTLIPGWVDRSAAAADEPTLPVPPIMSTDFPSSEEPAAEAWTVTIDRPRLFIAVTSPLRV